MPPASNVSAHAVMEGVVPEIARLFVRQQHHDIDPLLPSLLEELSQLGASECWHKKSTFKAHLYEVYKILRIWQQDDDVCRCGLLHSAYSNSYVNLAIFSSGTERSRVAALVGDRCEELIHLFCVVPRHALIFEQLLDQAGPDELNPLVPAGGVTVSHIKTGEPLQLDAYTLALFVILTMADFSEQLYSWQDCMFENSDGRLRYAGSQPGFLWPGEVKPGLWLAALSRMGRLAVGLRDAAVAAGDARAAALALPPVFGGCCVLLPEGAELEARDLYWRVVTQLHGPEQVGEAEAGLRRCVELNPHVGEPWLLLAQLAARQGRWEEAGRAAGHALRRLCDWGTAWDKRMAWDAWVAYCRVVLRCAEERQWPSNAFGMLNLGLVAR